MKTHDNVIIDNAADLDYSDLMDAVQAELEARGITGEATSIIADLMIRYDEDVIEDNDGQFYPESQYPSEYDFWLIYEDKEGNEFIRKKFCFYSEKEAREHADKLLANSMQADLDHIRVIKIN